MSDDRARHLAPQLGRGGMERDQPAEKAPAEAAAKLGGAGAAGTTVHGLPLPLTRAVSGGSTGCAHRLIYKAVHVVHPLAVHDGARSVHAAGSHGYASLFSAIRKLGREGLPHGSFQIVPFANRRRIAASNTLLFSSPALFASSSCANSAGA
jgi:hypothetical protein